MKKTWQSLLAASALVLLAVGMAAAPATAEPLKVRTEPATQVGAFSARLNGEVYIPWFSEQTAWAGYAYGLTASYGSETDFVLIKNQYGWVDAARLVEGLKPETTYHYMFGALNEEGEVSEGSDMTFTTSSLPRFEAASYPANLKAEQRGNDPISVDVENGSLTCKSITATGTLGATAVKATLTPVFSGCQLLGFAATVNTNGCTLQLVAGDPNTSTGKLDIACPAGQAISVTAGTCGITIPAQAGLSPVRMTSETLTEPDSLDLGFYVSGLTYTKTKDGFACPFQGTGTRADGALEGGQLLTATNASGSPILLKIGY